jgi:hypothetical protein
VHAPGRCYPCYHDSPAGLVSSTDQHRFLRFVVAPSAPFLARSRTLIPLLTSYLFISIGQLSCSLPPACSSGSLKSSRRGTTSR